MLARRLGTLDAALIVMGGVIGTGIFMNPSVVAQYLHTGPTILMVWAAGGLIALAGAFVFAELAARRASGGGLYGYLRDAFHPIVAFSFGWTALAVSQSGGVAMGALTFGVYFAPLTGEHWSPLAVGAATLVIFSLVNCLGVRDGTNTQNVLMIVKLVAVVGLIAAGIFAPGAATAAHAFATLGTTHPGMVAAFGLALVPVLFAYDGFQTASFVTSELRDPQRTLPRGMLLGSFVVIALYLAVNAICLHALGTAGLAATHTPVSDVARIVLGPIGERIMALVVAISTLGFLSNQILVTPRIYFQMAEDRVFFRQFAWVSPRTQAPVVAIVLQAVAALVIMLSGGYQQILSYVTCADMVFFGLAAIALFIFRKRDAAAHAPSHGFDVPGHPVTTALFLAVTWAVVLNLLITEPVETAIGLGILLTGVPLYFVFRKLAPL